MKCPNCNTVLVMSERQGVGIDYCPNCRGVWLDKGELDKIIEKSAANEIRYNTQADQIYDYKQKQEYYDKNDPDYKRKKKRGFLGDLFDFD
jgi:Zn-finger nucleic acid-binding protein